MGDAGEIGAAWVDYRVGGHLAFIELAFWDFTASCEQAWHIDDRKKCVPTE